MSPPAMSPICGAISCATARRSSHRPCRAQQFVEQISALLGSIHTALHESAQQRLAANIRTDITSFEALAAHFKSATARSGRRRFANVDFRGWALVAWARPEGAALAKVEQQLKSLKLTVRNAPLAQAPDHGSALRVQR